MRLAAVMILAMFLLIAGAWRATASEIGDGINGVTFSPDLEYSTASPEWTAWNRLWLGGAVAMYGIGDTVSTLVGLNTPGIEEGNPLYSSNPSPLFLIGSKIVVLGGMYCVIEYLIPEKSRQTWRNWLYGEMTVMGAAVTALNVHTITER